MKDKKSLKKITSAYNKKEIKQFRKENKNKIKILKIYFNRYAQGYTNDMGEILDKYNKQNFIELDNLYYMASKILVTSKGESNYFNDLQNNYYYYYYNDPFYYMDYHSHSYVDNSSSSGTGCSSCSSCGGGGAD